MNSAQEPLVIFFVPLGRTSPKCNPFLFKLWHKNFCPFFAESAKKTREQGGKIRKGIHRKEGETLSIIKGEKHATRRKEDK